MSEPDVQTKDFVTIGIEKARDTLIQTFKGTNIYLIIFLILLFLGVAFYVYTTYMSPMFENDYVANDENKTDNGEVDSSFGPEKKCDDNTPKNGGKTSPMEMYLIHTSWCPYSQKAEKEWEKLKTYYDSTMKGKYNIDFKEIDGDVKKAINKFTIDKLNNGKEKSTSEDWKEIEGYPTIYLIKDSGTIFEYEATPKKDTLIEFITQVDLAE